MKQKDCELVGKWARSMVNHLYWCVMSTDDCNSEVIMEKWLFLINHIHDKHYGHNQQYKRF